MLYFLAKSRIVYTESTFTPEFLYKHIYDSSTESFNTHTVSRISQFTLLIINPTKVTFPSQDKR